MLSPGESPVCHIAPVLWVFGISTWLCLLALAHLGMDETTSPTTTDGTVSPMGGYVLLRASSFAS